MGGRNGVKSDGHLVSSSMHKVPQQRYKQSFDPAEYLLSGKIASDQLLWSYLITLFQRMLLLKYVEYLKYLDQHCRAQIIERGGSYCIAKYAWVVVRLTSYSCKMLPFQSYFILQCVCLSHKIFHFEATMPWKPFENVGLPAEFRHTLQNMFAEVAYLSKQDIFPQVAKCICRKALKKL